MPDTAATTAQLQYPVAVLVEYQPVHDNRWIDGRWTVTGVVAGQSLGTAGIHCKRVHSGGGIQQYLWTGFRITLHPDDAESYYCNLMSESPGVFVVCIEEQDKPLQPCIVTLSYGEAASYMETDQRVERIRMPAELYCWLERYVLANYVPEKGRKRKRDHWKEAESGRR